ncbi:hypothetical protein MASR1M90_17990 [Desulfovibrionales bacterium]
MGLLDEWGDALVEEGLREAADTFFGARKALEDDIALFQDRVGLLKKKSAEIENWRAGLHCLFGAVHEVRELLSALGVPSTAELHPCSPACHICFTWPRSLTRKASFAKTVWIVYARLAELISDYTHGTYSPDPTTPGRMLLSVNLTQIHRTCAQLNERIATLNKSNRPSESLGFARRMDQARVAKERIAGGGGETWRLDADLSFPLLDCTALDLPVYSDLPVDSAARETLDRVSRAFYVRHREEANAVLAELHNSRTNRMCTLLRQ